MKLCLVKLCLWWTPKSRNPNCSKSQQTQGERRVNQLQGLHGMSSRRNSQSKMRVKNADYFLCDVLLSGRPVNVPDHTFHHPLNTFIHSVPAWEQVLSYSVGFQNSSEQLHKKGTSQRSRWQSILTVMPLFFKGCDTSVCGGKQTSDGMLKASINKTEILRITERTDMWKWSSSPSSVSFYLVAYLTNASTMSIRAEQLKKNHIVSHALIRNFWISFLLKKNIKIQMMWWGLYQTAMFANIWRIWFVGWRISITPQFFI